MKTTVSEQGIVEGAHIEDESVCQHHWMLESPAGPVSRGVCRVCGEERDFLNYIDGYHAWSSSDVSLDQLSGGSRYPAVMDERDKVMEEDG